MQKNIMAVAILGADKNNTIKFESQVRCWKRPLLLQPVRCLSSLVIHAVGDPLVRYWNYWLWLQVVYSLPSMFVYMETPAWQEAESD